MKKCGPYELLGLLGKGGMGSVHRGRHVVTGDVVALKLVVASDPTRGERLVREAELVRRLDHPGIARVHDAGEQGDVVFVAFDLIEGARPLDEALRELPPLARVGLIRDVARALGHAHARGVIHRDVKAENILVDPVGRARVTDFGIGMAEDLGRLTRSGVIVGTPMTLAPEQARSEREQLGPPTDVWALGVLLHEALVGEHPLFGAETPETLVEVLEAITKQWPRGPRDVDPQVPAALDAIVRRALAQQPGERFADGEAMAEALDAALKPLTRPRRSRRPTKALVATAVGVLGLVGVGAASSARSRRASAARDEGLLLLSASDAAGAVAALRSAEALSPGVVPEGVLGRALVSMARDALDRGDLAAAERALVEASGAPGSAALSFSLALARGDLDEAGRALPEGDRDAARRLVAARVERARARASASPAAAAHDLAAALSLDPTVDAREAAQLVAYAHADVPDLAPLEAALALAPDDVAAEAWIELALVGAEVARTHEALERALERATSPVRRGEVLAYLGRAQAAIETLQPHVDDPTHAGRARAMLTTLRQQQLAERPGGLTDADRQDLVLRWTDVIARDPTLVEPWASRALRRAELGDPGAIDDAARVCALRPAPLAAVAWQRAGFVSIKFGRWAEAVQFLDRALALRDGFLEARKQRGLARLRAGDLRGAQDDLQRVEREYPGISEVLDALIEVSLSLGETAAVRGLVDRAGQLRPGLSHHAWAAGSLADAGELVLAEGHLSALLADPAARTAGLESFALRLRARIRVELGDAGGALADAEALASSAPDSGSAHATLALSRLAAGDAAGGRAALEAARAARVPANGEHHAWLLVAEAWCELALDGDTARSLALLDQALAWPRPPWALGLAVRALVRRARGDLDGAREDARALLARLSLAPPDAWPVRTARDVLGR